jgi:bacterioferritin-associated ferredoxin
MTAIEDARTALAKVIEMDPSSDLHIVIRDHHTSILTEHEVELRAALGALIAEHERVVAARDEVQEKIAYLRRNCMGLPEQELRQKIGAVGEAEWKLGYYWNTLVGEERDRASRAEVLTREAERDRDSAQEALRILTPMLDEALACVQDLQAAVPTDAQVEAAAGARRCSWSIPEEDHPIGNLCRMEGHCLDTARAMLEAARDAS